MNRIAIILGFVLCLYGQAFAAAPNQIAVIYSGQILGHIEPCPTCGAKAYGGLARRAGMMRIVKKEHPDNIVLDIGGFAPQFKPDAKQVKICLDAMKYMGYDAMTVTAADLAIGPEKLKKWNQGGPEFVTTNLVDKKTGKPWANRYVLKEVNGQTVAIMSLLSTRAFDNNFQGFLKDRFEIVDLEKALRQALRELGDKPDFTILLSQAPRDETYALAQNSGKIDMIITSKLGRAIPSQVTLRPMFMQVENKGFELGVLSMKITGKHAIDPVETENILLDRSVASDPSINKMIVAAYPEKAKKQEQGSLNPKLFFRYLEKLE